MRQGDFEDWLRYVGNYTEGSIRSILSTCQRVERYEGDLDGHFEEDGMDALLGRLDYSTTDERIRQEHQAPTTAVATDTAQQQSRLKELIAKGKEQGHLTYAEVNDHLPDDIDDTHQIEDIISMINDMGIVVYESADAAPDADELLEHTPSLGGVPAREAVTRPAPPRTWRCCGPPG